MLKNKQLISPRFSIEQSTALLHIRTPSQLPFISEVKLRLQDGRYKLESYSCPCGALSEDIIIAEIDRYGLPLNSVLCMKCGTVRINPYLDATSLKDFYTHFYQKMYARAIELDSYFLRQASYGKKVLSLSQHFLNPESWICEVGCGAGGALKVFQDRGYQVAGCDYSNELIEKGKHRGIENIYYGSLDAIANNLNGVKFDLIYLHHVFEHLNDPLSFLKNCQKYLTPQGKIIIIIPDVSKIDEYKCPAGDLLRYLHIAHKYNFSFAGLQKMCHQAGYIVSKLNPDPKMESPGSDSSELWTQFEIDSNNKAIIESNKIAHKETDAGADLIRYLQKTEKLYSLGLCKGQLINRLDILLYRIRRLSPQKVLRKIQSMVLSGS